MAQVFMELRFEKQWYYPALKWGAYLVHLVLGADPDRLVEWVARTGFRVVAR